MTRQFNTAAAATHNALDSAECLSIDHMFDGPKHVSGFRQGQLHLAKKDWTEMYGLYKVATEGQCLVEIPPFWAVRGRTKWEAWKAQVGRVQAAP